jgi:nicotinamidase-related amidase
MSEEILSRSPDLLSSRESLLFAVDLQERLLPQIDDHETVVANCVRLLQAANLFEIPIALSEQYPKGLGPTAPAVTSALPESVVLSEKLRFSGAEATGWPAAGERNDGRQQVALAGIETHICILQTALDLLSRGYRVYVVADAVSSRRRLDHDVALARLRDSGAVVTTAESVLFEWCETAEALQFKAMRNLIAKRP